MLNADDISPDQYVTILQNILPDNDYNQGNIFGSLFGIGTITESKNREDTSFYGDVLKIKAVELPYVVLEVQNGSHKGYTYTGDIRHMKFILIGRKYRNALMKKEK